MTVRTITVGGTGFRFADLRELMAKATPPRSGDVLAGVAAGSAQERVAAQMVLADLPLRTFLDEVVVAYDDDEVTRLIIATHDAAALGPVASMTVGEFRDWLLSWEADEAALQALAPGVTPEMAAAVSKLMRVQDLVAVARKCRVVTAFRSTQGQPPRMATPQPPHHPTGCRDGSRPGCSPTTRPTTRWASRRRWPTACCWAPVTPCWASTRRPTGPRPCAGCWSCSTTCGSGTPRRCSRAC